MCRYSRSLSGHLEKSRLACRDRSARSVKGRNFTPAGKGEAEFFEVPFQKKLIDRRFLEVERIAF
jgi:hypothetical protein